MVNKGFRGGLPKKSAGYKRKNKGTGGDNYIAIKDQKKHKKSPPSATIAAAPSPQFLPPTPTLPPPPPSLLPLYSLLHLLLYKDVLLNVSLWKELQNRYHHLLKMMCPDQFLMLIQMMLSLTEFIRTQD